MKARTRRAAVCSSTSRSSSAAAAGSVRVSVRTVSTSSSSSGPSWRTSEWPSRVLMRRTSTRSARSASSAEGPIGQGSHHRPDEPSAGQALVRRALTWYPEGEPAARGASRGLTGGRPGMATTKTSIKKAIDTQVDLKNHREHCAPAARALASLGSGPGQQVRIHRNDEFALYTVSEQLHETTDAVVRMGPGGRQRLHFDGEFEGVLDTKVVDAGPVRNQGPRCRRADRAAQGRWLPDAPDRHRSPRGRHRATHRRAGRAGGRAPRPGAGQRLAGQGLGARRRRLRAAGTSPPPTWTPPASPCSAR